MATAITAMNEAQRQTYEMLLSEYDCLEWGISPEDDGAIVFEGVGVDGPVIGYIETDGKVLWLSGG